jgi:hypothetical protein
MKTFLLFVLLVFFGVYTSKAQYCAAGSPGTDEYISNVAIGTINQASGRGTGGYQDYTSQITNLAIGVYTSATITVAGYYPDDQILIWVDGIKMEILQIRVKLYMRQVVLVFPARTQQ